MIRPATMRQNPKFAAPITVLAALCGFFACIMSAATNSEEVQVAELQAQLLSQIAADARETRHYTGRGKFDAAVMDAMSSVPRHKFIDHYDRRSAYINRPLPIGHGQTISQPFIVALMTDLLNPQQDHRVLEIGTGSGYQAAVLAELVDQVYSIEIIPDLAESARERLQVLGFDNVSIKIGDGFFGWPDEGPFDGIIVTAASPQIPPALVEQLKAGARMVLPVGSPHAAQNLTLVTRREDGGYDSKEVLPVSFVPLTGDR